MCRHTELFSRGDAIHMSDAAALFWVVDLELLRYVLNNINACIKYYIVMSFCHQVINNTCCIYSTKIVRANIILKT